MIANTPNDRFIYSPALRMKAGELAGTALLTDDVANHVLPRWIVPPPKERDEDQAALFVAQRLPDVSTALMHGWGARESFVDAGWIIDEFGRDTIENWLPLMFTRARLNGCKPIPFANLNDLGEIETPAFRHAIDPSSKLKFGFCVPVEALDSPEIENDITDKLNELGLSAKECAVVADFSGLDFSNAEFVSPVLSGVLERLQEIGLWQHVIFQGTNYPEINPAPDGGQTEILRNEWIAWKSAVRFNPETAAYLVFGDFCADCSKIEFSQSGAPAIRHLRYASADSWFVVRGRKGGKSNEEMRSVYNRVVESDHFSSPRVSSADDYIYASSQDVNRGCGNSTTWRQLNTTRHISQVIGDIAKVKGIDLKPLPEPEEEVQYLLLDQ